MKLLSLVFFSFLLVATWNVSRREASRDVRQFFGLQSALKEMILKKIHSTLEDTVRAQVQSLSFSRASQGGLEAKYSLKLSRVSEFGETLSEEFTQGTIVLRPQKQKGEGHWSVSGVKDQTQQFIFNEPLTVRVGEGEFEGAFEAPPSQSYQAPAVQSDDFSTQQDQ